MIKKYLLGLLILLSGLSACKETYIDLSTFEEGDREAYLQANGIGSEYLQPSGIYFIPIVQTDERTVEEGKKLKAVYSVWLTNGKRITKAETIYYTVGEAIYAVDRDISPGIMAGLSLMHEGETARFVVPSSMAYGDMTYGDIPPYSTLIYEFTLLSTDLEADEQVAISNYLLANPDMQADEEGYYMQKLVTVDDEDLTYPEDGDLTTVVYTGYFTTGNPFDSNKTGFSVTIGNGAVVEGFDYAVRQLKIGEKLKILLPSEKAYGEDGSSSIPPYTPLIFVIERWEY